tara:strand:- start:5355 stop:5684 length:330 start_codon:yes stop_codon:yes gene_type:complete
MVKKIRLVDEDKTKSTEIATEVTEQKKIPKRISVTAAPITSPLNNAELVTELMELLKSMDWKLWELLQIAQRKEKADEEGKEVGILFEILQIMKAATNEQDVKTTRRRK